MTTPNSRWEVEKDDEESSNEEPSNIDLFKQKHPGAATFDDVKAAGADKLQSTTKAFLALIDSEHGNWGVVEDTLGDMLWVPGKGEIVGTWTRSKVDNLLHISLTTAIVALVDRSIQIWAKYAEERKAGKVAKTQRTARAPKDVVEEPVPELSIEEKLAFNSMRAKLKRK